MSKLSNIAVINQVQLLKSYEFAIKEKENILVIGPSGAGKTEMAFSACKLSNCKAIYWNMSVMERPDIQGLPTVSNDKQTSSFAPQEGMPFVGFDNVKKKRALKEILDNAEFQGEFEYFRAQASKELSSIQRNATINAIKECLSLFDITQIQKMNIDVKVIGNESSKNVLILDEIDKTPPENLQPLLELLLYRTINGRPLDIQSVIMTGNLPDEHTYSEPLSHAITNRSMIFELHPEPKIWLEWAVEYGIHPVVVGFLSRDENAAELFNKRPKNNDVYCYAYTSPRAWADCSRIIYKFDKWVEKGEIDEELRDKMISSKIGEEASTKIKVWLKYFKKYDKFIDSVFEGSNEPIKLDEDDSLNEITATIVIALALANKFGVLAKKSNDTPYVQEKATHVFNWIYKNTAKDISNAAFRSCYIKERFLYHKLQEHPATRELWNQIVQQVNKINKYQQEN